MSFYCYQIVKYADGTGYGLHGCWCGNNHHRALTEHPVQFTGESKHQLLRSLEILKTDVDEYPVFDELDDPEQEHHSIIQDMESKDQGLPTS
jgi:hypothetical protein